jgi:chorismate mutase-like protein
MGLNELRVRLDAIDDQMLALLSERAQVIVQVADVKRQHSLPIHIPERETTIIERLRRKNPGPLSSDTIEHIYRTIIEEMRQFECEHAVPSPQATHGGRTAESDGELSVSDRR